ncbi:TPA: hypothetical protein ACSTL5_001785 [Serratia fonticola]
MSKVTFVVDFPDGQTPTVSAGMDILGGRLCSVAWSDATAIKWNINDLEPPMHTRLLVTTVDGYVDVDTRSSISGWYDNDDDVIAWSHLPEPYTAPDDGEDS